METKPLLYGLIGFFLGGLLVSVAATTFDKPVPDQTSDMSVIQTVEPTKDVTKLSVDTARHDEVKQLSRERD
jgi:hypothetical protein